MLLKIEATDLTVEDTKELLVDIEALKEKYQIELTIKIQDSIDHLDYSPILETV